MVTGAVLPMLRSSGYFTKPSIDELVEREVADPGYCSRVPNFIIGRAGYGQIRFFNNTDVSGIDLNEIVRFDKHYVVVYEDETGKPPVGHGLNKSAEVTLLLNLKDLPEPSILVEALRCRARKQGARFLSFNPVNGEWKFEVDHFSRFGLVDEEEEDVVMDEAAIRHPIAEVRERDPPSNGYEIELSHSLPAHLGLDPAKMQEMRMAMFANEEEDEYMEDGFPSDERHLSRERMNVDSPTSSAKGSRLRSLSPLHMSSQKAGRRSGMPARKEPQALLEYTMNPSEYVPSTQGILMSGQNKGFPVSMTKVEGFKLPAEQDTPVAEKLYANCVVDAALFMGRSFRVGWGPNGILVHSGSLVNCPGTGLSSVIHIEKVASDKVVRDGANKIKDDLTELCFSHPMDLHKSLDHEFLETQSDSFRLKLQKVVANRLALPDICRLYIDIIERQLEVSDLSMSSRVLLMHQVTVWELIRVLFSERAAASQLEPVGDDQEGMVLDKKEGSANVDLEALPLVRRADFSNWLQDCVCHRVQGEVGSLSDARYLEHIILLLTGRQLDTATEVAASRGDVRLAILLSQAGGSMLNRCDLAQQLDLWKMNGLDFNYIEEDRLKIYELLAGNIQAALLDTPIDWKRYLGLIMWYQLPPDTALDTTIRSYDQLLGEGRVPYPVPVYIDEGPLDEALQWSPGDRFDISFYLMLLHANQDGKFGLLKTMFSAFSSSFDPLDYHMIWHQRSILEAIGAFSSNDLHLLDLSFVYQLLCLGKCHWAIYVILHMPYLDDAPYIHEKLIREILSQYCESWSKDDAQRQYIVDLGIPEEWMHEALALYHEYYGDHQDALENFIHSGNWKKAHTIFMTSVAHSMFLSSKQKEIWEITSALENHKSEIADWDLGAGLYIDFYILKNSMQEEIAMDDDSDPLEKKNESCRSFFGRLNDSLLVWGSKLPVESRACYSKMAEELCVLLMDTPSEAVDLHMGCFQTMLNAPVPDGNKSSYLQEAVTVFTEILCSDS
ncbi:hypothetical protein U9M48_006271 [Paspalum notatum var. saurae]|uniref:Peptidase S59 domain-containing protein n=1 Tax=Paspalum notatum var. saurae TaxID=547442 RepID=A0AAQ3PXI3_PASNO